MNSTLQEAPGTHSTRSEASGTSQPPSRSLQEMTAIIKKLLLVTA